MGARGGGGEIATGKDCNVHWGGEEWGAGGGADRGMGRKGGSGRGGGRGGELFGN